MAVTISLSHSAGTAVCALAKSSVALGCDLELIEVRSDAFVADYFTSGEQALVRAAAAPERLRLVTLLWSAKESALKALGAGLRLDTRSVEVSLGLQEDLPGWRPLQVRYAGGRLFHGWWQQTGKLLRTVTANPPPRLRIAVAPTEVPPVGLRAGP
jgi:4'-phosphopantetheinyl transferase